MPQDLNNCKNISTFTSLNTLYEVLIWIILVSQDCNNCKKSQYFVWAVPNWIIWVPQHRAIPIPLQLPKTQNAMRGEGSNVCSLNTSYDLNTLSDEVPPKQGNISFFKRSTFKLSQNQKDLLGLFCSCWCCSEGCVVDGRSNVVSNFFSRNILRIMLRIYLESLSWEFIKKSWKETIDWNIFSGRSNLIAATSTSKI